MVQQVEYHEAVQSTAAIAGHPLHPMLVPFPIASLLGALLADLAYWGTDDLFWAEAARWLTGFGLVTGALAAVLGLTDFLTRQRIRSLKIAWIHFLGNGLMLILALISLLLRLDDVEDAVVPQGLILSLLITGVLCVTGWLGGEMSYRYKIGVIESSR